MQAGGERFSGRWVGGFGGIIKQQRRQGIISILCRVGVVVERYQQNTQRAHKGESQKIFELGR